jgi:hypothetical protein
MPSVTSQRQGARELVIVVRDSGIGIDPAHMNQLFQPFFTTKTTGLGMGLAICRSIIEAHGGPLGHIQQRIWCNSSILFTSRSRMSWARLLDCRGSPPKTVSSRKKKITLPRSTRPKHTRRISSARGLPGLAVN